MAAEATVIRVLSKKRYKLTKTANNEAYVYEEYLSKHHDVRKYRDGAIVVRCHHVESCNSNEKVTVQAYHDGYRDEDPGIEFIGGTIGAAAEINFSGTPENDYPAVSTADLGSSGVYFSSMMAIKLTIDKAAAAYDTEFDLSVDLVLRS